MSLLCYTYSTVQGLAMKALGFRAILFFGQLEMFHNPLASWDRQFIFLVYSSPIVFMGVIAMLSSSLLQRNRRSNSLLRLYLTWGYILSFALFLGSFLQGVFTYHGLAVIFVWFKIPKVTNQVLGILFGAVLLASGFLHRNIWLKLAPSIDWQVEQHPKQFIVRVGFIPAILTFLLIGVLAFKVKSIQYLVLLASPLLFLAGILAFSLPLGGKMTLVRNFPIDKFSPKVLVVFIGAMLAMLYLAGHGLRIGF